MARTCDNCGATVKGATAFCPDCGEALGKQEAARSEAEMAEPSPAPFRSMVLGAAQMLSFLVACALLIGAGVGLLFGLERGGIWLVAPVGAFAAAILVGAHGFVLQAVERYLDRTDDED